MDGVEYREGITRCPDHDVSLVEGAPAADEGSAWTDGGYDRIALRIVFGVIVVAGVVHAVAGAAAAFIAGSREASGDDVTRALFLGDVATGAFRAFIGAIGVLGGTVLLRAYSNMTARAHSGTGFEVGRRGSHPPRTRLGTEVMRVLFVLSVVFTLLWVGTGILTAKDEAEYFYQVVSGTIADEPRRAFVTLSTLHRVSYYAGVACLVTMGGLLALTAYLRMGERPRPS